MKLSQQAKENIIIGIIYLIFAIGCVPIIMAIEDGHKQAVKIQEIINQRKEVERQYEEVEKLQDELEEKMKTTIKKYGE
ncbi:hypothetical protein [Burkholderia contaminans]|uniref:hypothetical protein n=1 Tax=Burkholderia contaminans TaxID=488447 RepID=UPI00158A3401|nr:hypothetical protein [Burkholderia contaminans]